MTPSESDSLGNLDLEFTVVGTLHATTQPTTYTVKVESVHNSRGMVNDSYPDEFLHVGKHLFPIGVMVGDRCSVKFTPYIESKTHGLVFHKSVTVFNEREQRLDNLLEFKEGYGMGFLAIGTVDEIFEREKFDIYSVLVESISLLTKLKHERDPNLNLLSIDNEPLVFNDAKNKYNAGDKVELLYRTSIDNSNLKNIVTRARKV